MMSLIEISAAEFLRNCPNYLISSCPVKINGFAEKWTICKSALSSNRCFADFIKEYSTVQEFPMYAGHHDMKGRYFYNPDLKGFNFEILKDTLPRLVDDLLELPDNRKYHYRYMGSRNVYECLPGLDFPVPADLKRPSVLESAWVGNKSIIACHYDAPQNFAVNISGHRRFKIFPPEQVANLYPGPLSPTPAGQVVSMVDFNSPDLDLYPNFEKAYDHQIVVDLMPGDALVIPSMWWHHVESFGDINMLLNYWWRRSSPHHGQGIGSIMHAILSVRDLPENEKDAWKALFNYYIFDNKANHHLPKEAQGFLSELDEKNMKALRTSLINHLNI